MMHRTLLSSSRITTTTIRRSLTKSYRTIGTISPNCSCTPGSSLDKNNNKTQRNAPFSVSNTAKHPFSAATAAIAHQPSEDTPPPPPTTTTTPPPTSPSKPTTEFQPTPDRKYHFFQNVEITPSGIAIIRFDDLNKKVNTISFALKDEAEQLWNDEIHTNDDVRGVVFASGKTDGFIAGADIFDIQGLEDKNEVVALIESAMGFFRRLKGKGVPLVCAINGPALGGGLEWALWCDYRICTDSSKTKLGLPEVKLGLLPGFGGTQNLPQLVGLQKAMEMMLTGKDIRPAQAKKMGLVDLVVSPHALEQVAIDTALNLANNPKSLPPQSKRRTKSLLDRILEDTPMGRYVLWSKIRETVQKNTNGNYPAPYAIIDAVQYGLDHPHGDDKFRNERENFAKLAATSESEALIGIFDGMTQAKKHHYGDVASPINRVAVMGAGLMGAGIAQVTAEKGYEVLLKDRTTASVDKGQDYMHKNWEAKLKKRRMTQYQRNLNSTNVVPLTDEDEVWRKHFARTDMIIEAVFEEINLKRTVVKQCEEATPDHCVFATNTSAIPIADIAEGAKRPEQIIGMHYFSPVPQMPLLEIIPHEGTSNATKAVAFGVGTKQGKTCIEVKDVPGFYVNRCLGPFLVEVSALVRDGVKLETLDAAIKKFGMPVGPVTLADEVGVDVVSHVADFLSNADLGVRMSGGDIGLMKNMIAKGWLGKKSGQGFYTYKDGKRTKRGVNPEVQAYLKEFVREDLGLQEQEIQDRIVSRFVNEAAKCLEDEIISDPTVGDIGLVFGTGFAPFRGGPFRYIDTIGADRYVGMMNGFADKYGPQFEPCQLLKDYAAAGKRFHS